MFLASSKSSLFKRVLTFCLTALLSATLIVPPSMAQSLGLPQPSVMVHTSSAFHPLVLKGLTIHPEDPLLFDFIVDNGQTGLEGKVLQAKTTKLVKYFLAGLTVPEEDLWVNLSPNIGHEYTPYLTN